MDVPVQIPSETGRSGAETASRDCRSVPFGGDDKNVPSVRRTFFVDMQDNLFRHPLSLNAVHKGVESVIGAGVPIGVGTRCKGCANKYCSHNGIQSFQHNQK